MNQPLNNDSNVWHEVDSSSVRFNIQFSEMQSIKYHISVYPNNKDELSSIDVYNRFLDDEILVTIGLETNRNAIQILQKNKHSKSSRIAIWQPTNKQEIRKFFGIIMYMGFVKYPKISDYCSNHILYKNQVLPKVMSGNRFQVLLQLIHFADNQTSNNENKISNIIG